MDSENTGPGHGPISRREFMVAASALALPLLAGCGFKGGSAREVSLRAGVCDALGKRTASACVGPYAERCYSGLSDAVAREAGIRLHLSYFKLDQQLIAAAEQGKLDVIIGKTWTALKAEAAGPRSFQRLADIPAPSGEALLRGMFIVPAASPLERLEDIGGRTLAMGSGQQYESSFGALRRLEARGVHPAETVEVESCLNASALAWEKQVDAAVVSDYCVDHSSLQLVGEPDAFRTIGRTEGVPFVTVAAARDLIEPVRSRLGRLLLALTGSRTPADLHTPALVRPTPWRPPELKRASRA